MPSPEPAASSPTAANHIRNVLMRGCIDELALPRVCWQRACRRSRACRAIGGVPPCLQALHPHDRRDFETLFALVERIRGRCHPPQRSTDAAQAALEDDALGVLVLCRDHPPEFWAWFSDWLNRYDAPPAPPAPPIDTSALLAEMRATLAHDKILGGMRREIPVVSGLP
jgi:hypothetical protein